MKRVEVCRARMGANGIYLGLGAWLILRSGPERFREGVFGDVRDTERDPHPLPGTALVLRLQIDDEAETVRVDRWGYEEALVQSRTRYHKIPGVKGIVPRGFKPDNT